MTHEERIALLKDKFGWLVEDGVTGFFVAGLGSSTRIEGGRGKSLYSAWISEEIGDVARDGLRDPMPFSEFCEWLENKPERHRPLEFKRGGLFDFGDEWQ